MNDLMDTMIETATKNVQKLAKLNKVYFDALLNEGFTRAEAISIISSKVNKN